MQYDVTEQFEAFRCAVVNMIGTLEKHKIGWKDEDRYHNVDRLFEVLFQVFVIDYVSEELDLSDSINGYVLGFEPFCSDNGGFFGVLDSEGNRLKFVDYLYDSKALDSMKFIQGGETQTLGTELVKSLYYFSI